MALQDETAPFPPLRSPDRPLDPPQSLVQLTKEPLQRIRHWDGSEPWLITRYEDVHQVLSSPKFSANPRTPGYPEKTPSFGAMMSADRNLRTMDGEEHRAQKQMVLRDFLPARVKEMIAGIQAYVDRLIDEMITKGAPADIVHGFAEPVPIGVICELFGVPVEEAEIFKHAHALIMSTGSAANAGSEAGDELYQYLDGLLDRKMNNPENDLISRLAVEQVKAGKISRKDGIGLARLILMAGHDTTANMLGGAILALLLNPAQKEFFTGNLAASERSRAVDELFRYVNVTHSGRRRVAIEDITVSGQLIAAGEGVICMTNIADRDEKIFPEADRLDLTRTNAHVLMGFGSGPHKCIGAYLSRVEIDIALTTLFARLPNLALAEPVDDLKLRQDMMFGLKTLSVTW